MVSGSFQHFKGIILDLDDTLAPEKEFVYSGFMAVAEEMERRFGLVAERALGELRELFDRGERKLLFNRVLEENAMPYSEQDISQLLSLYRRHRPSGSYRLYEDAGESLPYLAGNFLLALITDGDRAMQERKIGALGIGSLFSPLIINESREYFKPHPRSYEKILKEWEIPPCSIAVLGDNVLKDFVTPKAMGMLTVRIARGGIYRAARGKKLWRAEYTVKSTGGFLELLARLDRGFQGMQ
ncbi:MAG: HAD family hydrolase [Candidatus Eremiobacteraeota bacterium]|nr:HAD family hydrolase [Candidatus Eremiobacteraeota bacterium]